MDLLTVTAQNLRRPSSSSVPMAAAPPPTNHHNTVQLKESEMICPVHREAYFLSPVDGSDRPVPSPYLQSTMPAVPPKFETLRFPGWKLPTDDWKAWTLRMHTKYGHVWKKAGIYAPILNSCCQIHRNNNVILGFAERWNSSTNTFVFPWGEATVTLEDMMVIGGYSVLGEPVFTTIDPTNSDLMKVEQDLESERRKLNSISHKVPQSKWLTRFMNTGSPIEHEAFLAMWLSKFVFPRDPQSDTIGSHVLPLAVLLARGIRIALAPAVLAGIYDGLSHMKDAIQFKSSEMAVFAPLQVLQIWIWERFSDLRPFPALHRMEPDTPWFQRWDRCKCERPPTDVRKAIDSGSDVFSWRPCNGKLTAGSNDKPKTVFIDPNLKLDERTESRIRCFRHAELVGMDGKCCFIRKQYLPHRVARQFGLDQDVPGFVPRFDSDKDEAWRNYSRTVSDVWVHVPGGLDRGGMSARYQRWWYGFAP